MKTVQQKVIKPNQFEQNKLKMSITYLDQTSSIQKV